MKFTKPSPKADWVAHFIFLHMKLEDMNMTEFLKRSGFPKTSMTRFWQGRLSPRLKEAEAMLNVFDYELKATPRDKKVSK